VGVSATSGDNQAKKAGAAATARPVADSRRRRTDMPQVTPTSDSGDAVALTDAAKLHVPEADRIPGSSCNSPVYILAAHLVRCGEWSTYGDIGEAVTGRRGIARAVAKVLAMPEVDAHRVIRDDGTVPPHWYQQYPDGHFDTTAATPQAVLQAEGVVFNGANRADIGQRVSVAELERRIAASAVKA
jgi:alkylated DNA nucleotide flippase Atl1